MCVLFVLAVIIMFVLKLIPTQNRDFIVGKSNNTPFFNMIYIYLGGAITLDRVPVRNFARTIFLIWLLFSLVIRNAYQGKLFDNLRSKQRMAPLFRLNDLFQSDLRLYLMESFYQNVADILPAEDHWYIVHTKLKRQRFIHGNCEISSIRFF